MDIDPVMARIVIPSIHVSLPVYHGTDSRTLADSVGHLFGTSLPIGGPSTHAVLTGHTGLSTATMFDNLNQVKKGDPFYVSSLGQTLKYEVVDITVVKPEETDSLRKVPGRDLVTLITCTPYGVNSHRLLVTGERVPMDPTAAAAEEAEALPAPMQTWMKVIIVAVVIILTVVAGILGRLWWLRRRRKQDAAKGPEGITRGADPDGSEGAERSDRRPGDPLEDAVPPSDAAAEGSSDGQFTDETTALEVVAEPVEQAPEPVGEPHDQQNPVEAPRLESPYGAVTDAPGEPETDPFNDLEPRVP